MTKQDALIVIADAVLQDKASAGSWRKTRSADDALTADQMRAIHRAVVDAQQFIGGTPEQILGARNELVHRYTMEIEKAFSAAKAVADIMRTGL